MYAIYKIIYTQCINSFMVCVLRDFITYNNFVNAVMLHLKLKYLFLSFKFMFNFLEGVKENFK
jgi:hypothetical protein